MHDWDTPHTIRHHIYSDGATDELNRTVGAYTPPLSGPGTPVKGFGFEGTKSEEPHPVGHPDRVVMRVKLFAPPGFAPGPRDVIDIPGVGKCDVLGIAETADGNPFGWNPGSTILLRKVIG